MDNTELERRQAESDKNIRGISLGVGALPAAGLMARLFQATQGYKTGMLTGPGGPGVQPYDPQALFDLIKQLVDAEIQLFLQGFITLEQLSGYVAGLLTHDAIASLGFIDNSVLQGYGFLTTQAIPTIERDIAALIPTAATLTKETVNALYGFDLSIAQEANSVANTVKNGLNRLIGVWNSMNILGIGFPHIDPL